MPICAATVQINIALEKINYTTKVVPNVKGMLIDDAVALLENEGLKVSFYGKGKSK